MGEQVKGMHTAEDQVPMTGKQETEAEKHRLRHEKEMKRLNEMYAYEREAFEQGFGIVAGIDEAGRGPLAGPVVAACVILPQYCLVEGINDSKKLSPPKREKLYDVIMDRAISVGIGIVDEKQ